MKKIMLMAAMGLMLMGCTGKNQDKQTEDMKEQIILENIQTRVSVRHFTGEKILQADVEKLLRAAMAAPSAVNKQPWAFLVISDQQLLDKIGEDMPASRCGNGAAVAIVLCGDMDKALEGEAREYWAQDVSAATENLLLAAHGMGLGAVWSGIYPISERVKYYQELLGMPEHIVPLCIVPVGVPAEQPAVKEKYHEELIHYNRW